MALEHRLGAGLSVLVREREGPADRRLSGYGGLAGTRMPGAEPSQCRGSRHDDDERQDEEPDIAPPGGHASYSFVTGARLNPLARMQSLNRFAWREAVFAFKYE